MREEPPAHWLTLKDAAKHLQMSYDVFRSWYDRGAIQSVPVRPGSTRRKIFVAELDRFMVWIATEEADQLQ